MGELIVMPVRHDAATEAVESNAAPVSVECHSEIDFSVWQKAPKERTPAYFPTYTAISKTLQTALRGWVREWFAANPEILLRPHTAYPILVYQCTHPFSGRTLSTFTYDIQQTDALNRAFASAASRLGGELKRLDTKRLSWFTREHYFAYRSKEVVKYVMKNRRAIYRMLNVETVLVNSIIKFAIIDIPQLGLEDSLVLLRRVFNTQLRRFSDEFDLGERSEELLRLVTNALVMRAAAENSIEMPLAA